jgi:L-alanine-DL-glutamate epimerase-like enolase superfamily enzyme
MPHHCGEFVNFVEVGNQIQRSLFRAENGDISIPTGPGLGIDVDDAALERFTHREYP